MNEADTIRRFVREALPLLSSYFYSENVELEPTNVQVGDENADEYQLFATLLRLRHALACGLKLKPIVEAIKRNYSQSSELVRAESKGAVFGRINIPLYLNRRAMNVSWPRTFPVIIAKATSVTPENRLVADTLQQFVRRLNEPGHLEASAERMYCINLLRWSREQLHSDPWNTIVAARSSERLRREVEHRLRRRQTGNEQAYGQFLEWYKQWLFDTCRNSLDETERLVNLLLAFPPGEFFGNRVFEIWCLHQLIEAFRRCGAETVDGPRALSARSGRPVCIMHYEGYKFEVWFQKALPANAAKWKYTHSENLLGGIPDIIIIGDDDRHLLVDAKRREVRNPTRSEETYKLLGYMENFRPLFAKAPFWGILCFLSSTEFITELSAEGDHRIALVGAHVNDAKSCKFGFHLDRLVGEWLQQRALSGV